MIWGAVIVAPRGAWERGSVSRNNLVEVGGKPMLVAWSVEVFASMPEISDIVIVTEREFIEDVQEVVLAIEYVPRLASLLVVAGGADAPSQRARAGSRRCRNTARAFSCTMVRGRSFVRPTSAPACGPVRRGVASLLAGAGRRHDQHRRPVSSR